MKKVVLVTGGFDPLHSGHIDYINAAKKLGDELIVGLNSDSWLTRKKGRPFMPYKDRLSVIRNLKSVNGTVEFNDDDNSSKDAIRKVRLNYPSDRIVFANGGDRTHLDIPEMDIKDDNLEFAFGVGGFNKQNSSSWILQEWKAPKTERPWGYYRILHEASGIKVKELTVNPGESLSMQRHQQRAEYWMVSEGSAVVNATTDNGYYLPAKPLEQHQEYHVPVAQWHQLTNPFNEPCKIVEIQYGKNCIEEDIERR
jgi:cytidyltransferase-like protein